MSDLEQADQDTPYEGSADEDRGFFDALSIALPHKVPKQTFRNVNNGAIAEDDPESDFDSLLHSLREQQIPLGLLDFSVKGRWRSTIVKQGNVVVTNLSRLSVIFSALKSNHTVSGLCLRDSGILDHWLVREMPKLLNGNNVITHINLSKNRLGSVTAHAINMSLCSSFLASVDLSENCLGPDAGPALAQGVSASKTLKELYLGHNNLGAEGVRLVCEVISRRCAAKPPVTELIELDISDNGADDTGMIALGPWIEATRGIKSLDLSENELTNLSAEALSQALEVRMMTSLLENESIVWNPASILLDNNLGITTDGVITLSYVVNAIAKRNDMRCGLGTVSVMGIPSIDPTHLDYDHVVHAVAARSVHLIYDGVDVSDVDRVRNMDLAKEDEVHALEQIQLDLMNKDMLNPGIDILNGEGALSAAPPPVSDVFVQQLSQLPESEIISQFLSRVVDMALDEPNIDENDRLSLFDASDLVDAVNEVLFNNSGETHDTTTPLDHLDFTIQQLYGRMQDLVTIIDTPPTKFAHIKRSKELPGIDETMPRLGLLRLKIIDVFVHLYSLNYHIIDVKLAELGVLPKILDLFFLHRWSNDLHFRGEALIALVLQGGCQMLRKQLLLDYGLVDKIMPKFILMEEEVATQQQPSCGYMAHLRRIARQVFFYIIEYSDDYACCKDETQWNHIIHDIVEPLDAMESVYLGGFKPDRPVLEDVPENPFSPTAEAQIGMEADEWLNEFEKRAELDHLEPVGHRVSDDEDHHDDDFVF